MYFRKISTSMQMRWKEIAVMARIQKFKKSNRGKELHCKEYRFDV